jgi:hypothetical protein
VKPWEPRALHRLWLRHNALLNHAAYSHSVVMNRYQLLTASPLYSIMRLSIDPCWLWVSGIS